MNVYLFICEVNEVYILIVGNCVLEYVRFVQYKVNHWIFREQLRFNARFNKIYISKRVSGIRYLLKKYEKIRHNDEAGLRV